VLTKEGVEIQFLARKSRPTTLAYVDEHRHGFDRYTFYGQGTADRSVTIDDLPQILEDWACLHFGSYSCVVEPTATSFHNLAKREAGKRLLSFDPNVRLTVESDLELWRQRVESFAELADIIKVSEEDIGLLFPGATFETIANRWRRGGAKLVVVTRGESGAVTLIRNEVYQASGRQVPVADTVGAGDSFVAALLCALNELGKATREGLNTLSIDECRRVTDFSIKAAAITCSRRGADLPRRSELPDV
jgi:fructokinase